MDIIVVNIDHFPVPISPSGIHQRRWRRRLTRVLAVVRALFMVGGTMAVAAGGAGWVAGVMPAVPTIPMAAAVYVAWVVLCWPDVRRAAGLVAGTRAE
jgi:hypothetical protein